MHAVPSMGRLGEAHQARGDEQIKEVLLMPMYS
jgi:hypothetical protein